MVQSWCRGAEVLSICRCLAEVIVQVQSRCKGAEVVQRWCRAGAELVQEGAGVGRCRFAELPRGSTRATQYKITLERSKPMRRCRGWYFELPAHS